MAKKRVRRESKKRKKKWRVGKDTLPRILLGEYVDAILAWGKNPGEDIVPCELRRAGMALVDFLLEMNLVTSEGERLNRHKSLLDAWSEAKGFFDFAEAHIKKARDKFSDDVKDKMMNLFSAGLKDREVARKLIESGAILDNPNAMSAPAENIARMRRDIAKKADAADKHFLKNFDCCFDEQHKGEAEILLSRFVYDSIFAVTESSQDADDAPILRNDWDYGLGGEGPPYKPACIPPYDFPLQGISGNIYYQETDLEGIDFAEKVSLEKFEFTKEKDGGYRSPVLDMLNSSGSGAIRSQKT